MILLFRANGITASRVNKYVDFYKSRGINFRIIGWDRLGEKLQIPNYEFFNYRSQYVQGGWRAMRDKIHWMKFVYDYIIAHRDEVKVVHACDIDVAFPVALAKKKLKGSFHMIFDSCDWASATANVSYMQKIFSYMENKALKQTDDIIICEPERIRQMPQNLPVTPVVMRNIPSFENRSFLFKDDKYAFPNDKITVSYMGWFGHGRFIDELLSCAEKGIINLLIGGFGMVSIEERCKYLNEKYKNIKFMGKMEYKKGLNMMYNSDLIYAMYCKNIPNHMYAAPNKFYESMFLGRPILSTKGINMEHKIQDEGIGYNIDETQEELDNFMRTITREELQAKGLIAASKWEKYNRMTDEFMNKYYSQMIGL